MKVYQLTKIDLSKNYEDLLTDSFLCVASDINSASFLFKEELGLNESAYSLIKYINEANMDEKIQDNEGFIKNMTLCEYLEKHGKEEHLFGSTEID